MFELLDHLFPCSIIGLPPMLGAAGRHPLLDRRFDLFGKELQIEFHHAAVEYPPHRYFAALMDVELQLRSFYATPLHLSRKTAVRLHQLCQERSDSFLVMAQHL